jgi:hypothetical protein
MIQAARFTTILAAATLLTAAETGSRYRFRTFEVCQGCPTATGGIDDTGLVGATYQGAVPLQGYIFDTRTNTASPVPGSLAMTVPSDSGRVPGFGFGPGGLVPIIREQNGTVTVLEAYPGAVITALLQFNGSGASIGWASQNFTTFFSFLRSADGRYTKLVYPGPVGNLTLGTFLLGWNERGTMVGYLADPTETQFAGLLRHTGGQWEVWNIPGAMSTIIYAITEAGTLAGSYKDRTGWHGFVWSRDEFQTVDSPGAANTNITGINNRGDLVGFTFTGDSPLQSVPSAFVAVREGGR